VRLDVLCFPVCDATFPSRGSAISRIVGANVRHLPRDFDPTVRMWVFEELVEGEKLSEVINTRHENVKYLPGKLLPDNVVLFWFFRIFANFKLISKANFQVNS